MASCEPAVMNCHGGGGAQKAGRTYIANGTLFFSARAIRIRFNIFLCSKTIQKLSTSILVAIFSMSERHGHGNEVDDVSQTEIDNSHPNIKTQK